jgi:hypothetical protein
MSLIPEKPIVISPTLAATIGLEETVLLQLLQECRSHGTAQQSQGYDWITVGGEKLLSLTPFWREDDIRRLSMGLHEKGLLLIGGAPFVLPLMSRLLHLLRQLPDHRQDHHQDNRQFRPQIQHHIQQRPLATVGSRVRTRCVNSASSG